MDQEKNQSQTEQTQSVNIPQGDDLERLQKYYYHDNQSYKPRPKWQLVYAWILILIVVAGICCSIYWLAIASAAG